MILNKTEIRLSLLTFGSLISFALLSWQFQQGALGTEALPWMGIPCGVMIFTTAAIFAGAVGWSLWTRTPENEARRMPPTVSRIRTLQRSSEREIRRREARAESFLAACQELFEKGGVEDIAETVLCVVEKTLGADQGSVMLLDDKKRLRIAASRGINEKVASCVHLQLGERVAGLSIFERREFLINGDLGNYPLFKDLEANPIIRSAMICPILYREEALGVLNINRTLKSAEDFNQDDLRVAMLLARQVGLALHHARMCSRLRERTEELMKIYRELKDSRLELLEFEKQNSGLFLRGLKAG